MPSLPLAVLKPGRDVPARAGHPWIFSEALSKAPIADPGALVQVQDARGGVVGVGTWNPHTSIRIRLLSRDITTVIDETFFLNRFTHLANWKEANLPANTTGYRLVHAEADELPGLIIDRYANAFVFQIHTAGMEPLREKIISALTTFAKERGVSDPLIVERSDIDARTHEGMRPRPASVHVGEFKGPVVFQEYGITFQADVLNGQKTGFFLDQREARHSVGMYAKGKRVLNLFGYTGAFSIHALMGGASFVQTVDVSRKALEEAQAQFKLNGINPDTDARIGFLEADVFDLLNEAALPDGPYDIIICDPPALAKTAAHVPQALKGYTFLNGACLSHLKPGGILVSSSCSGRVDPEAFRNMLRLSAGRAKRTVRLLDWITQPVDHAERLAFPEGRYLKTAIVEVTDILA